MNIIQFKTFLEDDGVLMPLELNNYIDFVPKRCFFVTNVPKGEERGNHAHFKTKQLLVCIKGKIKVKLYDGNLTETCVLEPYQGVLINEMIWDSQVFMTGDDVLFSLCSTNYDKSDYINTLEDFNKFLAINKDQ